MERELAAGEFPDARQKARLSQPVRRTYAVEVRDEHGNISTATVAVRFRWLVPAMLPVWWEGRIQIVRWGNRDRRDRALPPTGWTWRATVEEGKWVGVEPEPVEVPANYALMNGVWYRVRRGLRGLLVRPPRPAGRWCT